jgi:hydrogenase nickel incorporation protein HypA/HybF
MHELSIAQNIVEIVQQNIPPGDGRNVTSVRMKVGRLSGIVVDSLEFCFDAIINNTFLQGAKLEIESVPVVLHCKQCGTDTTVEGSIFTCPECGSIDIQLISGTELQVVEIELADEVTEAV